jgi:hypothetical protein
VCPLGGSSVRTEDVGIREAELRAAPTYSEGVIGDKGSNVRYLPTRSTGGPVKRVSKVISVCAGEAIGAPNRHWLRLRKTAAA